MFPYRASFSSFPNTIRQRTQPEQFYQDFHPFQQQQQYISSQTPYGPHVPSNGLVVNMLNPPQPQEEISTIFVVGFPEDMQEREFQNMFTFSPGFEAATLKVPNKDYTAYGTSSLLSNSNPGPASRSLYAQYGGSNDPYNLVTVNQGGVVVDGGRDGTVASWPSSMSSSSSSASEEPSHHHNHFLLSGGNPGMGSSLNAPPRKQIIGFAKFRSRNEALEARDVLQGRRVDIEKGAVLKAEMAKKNLHTKRGVGPVSGTAGGSMIGMSFGADMSMNTGLGPMGMGMTNGNINMMNVNSNSSLLPQQQQLDQMQSNLGWRDHDLGGPSLRERERERELPIRERELPMSAMSIQRERERGISISAELGGFNNNITASGEREREVREAGLINAMGLSGSSFVNNSRGPRERAEDEERERVRRSLPGLKNQQQTAIPISRQSSGAPLSSFSFNGSNDYVSPAGEGIGPWDSVGRKNSMIRSVSPSVGVSHSVSSGSSSSSVMFSPPPPIPMQMNNNSYSYSTRSSESGSVGDAVGNSTINPNDNNNGNYGENMIRSFGSLGLNSNSQAHNANANNFTNANNSTPTNHTILDSSLAVSTSTDGNSSPELPSPASSGSGGGVGTRNVNGNGNGTVVDQNPPINTLYVGNLPTAPPPSGYPHDHLEESLRDLFSTRPGFRRLCFRQKNNGPMCFVEFEDVAYATKTLNDLYGHTLNGLVKGGGIRLSYSKNPLGVRTPTSAGSSGGLEQQQQNATVFDSFLEATGPANVLNGRVQQQQPGLLRRDLVSPPPPQQNNNNSNAGYGAPRFFSSTGSSHQLSGSSETFMPRNGLHQLQQQYGGNQNNTSHMNMNGTFSPFGVSSPVQQPAHLVLMSNDQHDFSYGDEQQHRQQQQQQNMNVHYTTST